MEHCACDNERLNITIECKSGGERGSECIFRLAAQHLQENRGKLVAGRARSANYRHFAFGICGQGSRAMNYYAEKVSRQNSGRGTQLDLVLALGLPHILRSINPRRLLLKYSCVWRQLCQVLSKEGKCHG